ncbi:GDP-mannose transporter [Nematocida sp. AWRm77]|nr:GDP-mannose transporter [Nematocida sp. AWRm77]
MGLKSFFVILFLTGSGVANTVLNKYLVSNLGVKPKFFILSVQTGVTLSLLFCINKLFLGHPADLFHEEVLKRWMAVAFSLITMIYSGLQANEYLPISLFTVLKNGAIPIVVLHDSLFFGYALNALTVLAFLLIAVSSFIGTLANTNSSTKEHSVSKKGNLSNTVVGLAWMGINCLSSASYSIRLNMAIKETKLPSVSAALYTNALAFPFLLGLALIEAVSVRGQTAHLSWILFSGTTSCVISVATAWAASLFSTTTMTMIAALNKTPTALSGILVGIEEIGSAWKWASILLGVLSGVCYAASRSARAHINLESVVKKLAGV